MAEESKLEGVTIIGGVIYIPPNAEQVKIENCVFYAPKPSLWQWIKEFFTGRYRKVYLDGDPE